MAAYDITLQGCDDKTTVTADLEDREVALLQSIALATQAESAFDCQPTMTVKPHQEVNPDE